MRIGKSIGVIVLGYFVIGGLIALTQLGITKLFEPPCHGIVLHTLWAHFPRRIEIMKFSKASVKTLVFSGWRAAWRDGYRISISTSSSET